MAISGALKVATSGRTLYSIREKARIRDTALAGSIGAPAINYNQMVTPGGVMQYIEVDAGNIAKWLAPGGGGHASFDPLTAPNDYTVYVSDRRGNWVNGAAAARTVAPACRLQK